MSINDDFTNKAETEMKMHDAKMMEQARLRKLAGEPLEARIAFALSKKSNDAEEALVYMKENHLILPGEHVTEETIRATQAGK
jgi:hypothetical protein